MKVSDVMSSVFTIVPPETTLQAAAQMMRDGDFGYLAVGEGDQLQGTLTDRDLVIRALADAKSADTPIADILTRGVVTCHKDDDVKAAADLMRQRQIRRLAVLDSAQRLVGVISVGDIARATDDNKLTGKIETAVAQPV